MIFFTIMESLVCFIKKLSLHFWRLENSSRNDSDSNQGPPWLTSYTE